MADLFFEEDEERDESHARRVDEDDTGEHPAVAAPPRRRRRRGRGGGSRLTGWLGVALFFLLLVLVVGALAAVWVQRRLEPPGAPGRKVAFTVPQGATASEVADGLEDAGIIADSRVFRYYVRFTDAEAFRAGDYRLRRNSDMADVVDVLEAGPALPFEPLTIPEGLWVTEVAARVATIDRLSAQRFADLAAFRQARSRYQPDEIEVLEGLLFPDTYQVDATVDEAVLLERMVEHFDDVAGELGYDDALDRVGIPPYQAIIVASLVEAEARADVDRPRIARVIYNRLAAGEPLGIDASVYYALGRRGGSLDSDDLEVDSPYNTRVNAGLPPTPIAMPGRASLEAALNPEPGPWRWYVLQDPTTHAFYDNYDDFLAAVDRAQAAGLIP